MDIRSDGPALVLRGDFDARSTSAVRAALRERLCRSDHVVVIDLTEVRAVDLAALRVLAYASHAAPRTGQQVRLRGCGPQVLRMLHLSRLIRFVEVDREAA